jgi:hypothetical protein|tara:strand:+ start:1602 stop:1781 length:180 start_codon:yes stop_codon:yes gene_type:complete
VQQKAAGLNARLFAREGAADALTDIDTGGIMTVAEEIEAAGRKAIGFRHKMVEETESKG